MNIRESLVKEIKKLNKEGKILIYYEAKNEGKLTDSQVEAISKIKEIKELDDRKALFRSEYQSWYLKAMKVVKQLTPERYSEFTNLYKLDKAPKELDYTTYTISDYLNGVRVTRGYYKEEVVNPFTAFYSKFELQTDIINSISSNVESIIVDIEGTIQSNFFHSEIMVAEELLKKKHFRASGAICGVVLEKHFSSVCRNHNITFRKKNITISDYCEW